MNKSTLLILAASLLAMSTSSTAHAGDLMSVSSNSLYFGSITSGKTSDLTLTLYSHSIFKIQNLSASGFSSGFNFKGGSFPGSGGDCGSSLSAGKMYVPATGVPGATSFLNTHPRRPI